MSDNINNNTRESLITRILNASFHYIPRQEELDSLLLPIRITHASLLLHLLRFYYKYISYASTILFQFIQIYR